MPFQQSDLGGGNKGVQSKLIGHTDSGGERSSSRKQLNKAFGNMYNKGLGSSPLLYSNNILGPFRTAINGGDVITNYNESTNSIYGVEPSQNGGLNQSRINGLNNGVNRNGNAMYSGNIKYVYDSSNYIKFKKLQAMNKTYNDKNHGSGGNSSYTSVAIHRVRV
jgi:hypothetical protein